jgi:hypothetical protein
MIASIDDIDNDLPDFFITRRRAGSPENAFGIDRHGAPPIRDWLFDIGAL